MDGRAGGDVLDDDGGAEEVGAVEEEAQQDEVDADVAEEVARLVGVVRPVPLPVGLVVKKGWNILSNTYGGMGSPLFEMVIVVELLSR